MLLTACIETCILHVTAAAIILVASNQYWNEILKYYSRLTGFQLTSRCFWNSAFNNRYIVWINNVPRDLGICYFIDLFKDLPYKARRWQEYRTLTSSRYIIDRWNTFSFFCFHLNKYSVRYFFLALDFSVVSPVPGFHSNRLALLVHALLTCDINTFWWKHRSTNEFNLPQSRHGTV